MRAVIYDHLLWSVLEIICGFLGCAVVEVVGDVRCSSLFLYLCGGLIFCIHLLGCLVRRVWGNYLSIGFSMTVRRRVYVFGPRRF